MTKIDENIFEEVRRFEEGELSEAERQEMARKVESDEQYRLHRQYYQTVVGAIGRAQQMAELKALHRQGVSPEQAEAFDTFIEQDRRAARRRARAFQAAVLVLAALVFFLAGRWTAAPAPVPAPMPEEKTTPAPGPVAQSGKEIADEEPMGFGGEAEAANVLYKKITRSGSSAVISQPETRQAKLYVREGGPLQAVYQNNTLQLFVPDAARLKASPVVWTTLVQNGEERNFLKIDGSVYEFEPSAGKVELRELQDEKLLQWLK